ncbi:cyclic AMP-dependent transcription factor ATF-6 alpha-like [Ptychodera flava]|uniref:cyclic AMP-dependent transcription factor ATF-6 alpha-like n=1 Tax=Ptychodera flava TaxID=63121 RepID=UPI003969BDEB
MALDFVSEADQKFLADNFLSLDDWGADLKEFEPFTDDKFIQEIPDLQFQSVEGVEDAGSPFTCDSSDAFSTDLTGEPWESPLHTDDLLDGIIVKSEPRSPSSSSCSDLSSESIPQLLNSIGSSEQFEFSLDSPPLTPPREDPLASPQSPPVHQVPTTAAVPSAIPAVVTTILPVQQNKVAILPKPISTHPAILPKLEPTSTSVTTQPSTATVKQTLPAQTITLKQIPVTVSTQPVVVNQTKNINVISSTVNGVSYQPPVKQSKIVTPGSNGVSIPVTTAPPKDGDMKAWKRQQRMIKNRESACLSRKKKKEYLQGLEGTLHEYSAENEKLKSENELLRRKIIALQEENKKLRSGQSILPNPKKRTACLLAVVFFFAVNIAPLSLINSNYGSQSDYLSSSYNGRALLSFDEEVHKIDDNITNIDDVIRHTLQSTRNVSSHFDADSKDLMVLKEVPAQLSRKFPSCALFNTTDTVRLVDELTGWVHGHEAELQEKKKQEKQKDLRDKLFKKKQKTMKSKLRVNSPQLPDVNADETSLQVYDHLFEKSYTSFIEALNRRNDTFYVVSFRKDHLLLPATAHNSTQRPKMSLVMPAIGMNETMLKTPDHHFSMMQIDCEVVNTRVVHVKHTDPYASEDLKDIVTSVGNQNETVNTLKEETSSKSQRHKGKLP